MGRSAKARNLPEPWESPSRGGVMALLGFLGRNPAPVGGTTAFLVAFCYVSANALWYQPHAHLSAFFATRNLPDAERFAPEPHSTTIRIERPDEEAARPASDPVLEQVQRILKSLSFYAGDVDGLSGPNTRKAIEAYQAKMGMTVTGMADDALLEQLGAPPTTAGIKPAAKPRPTPHVDTEAVAALPGGGLPDGRVAKIQAGLKAFGNDTIEVDGVLGARTKSAIKEFQALFGLRETSEPNDEVYAKMREIGLTN